MKALAEDRLSHDDVKRANDSLFRIMLKTKSPETKKACENMIIALTERYHILGMCSVCCSDAKNSN